MAYLLKDAALLQAQQAWAVAHPQALSILGQVIQIAIAEGRFSEAHDLIENVAIFTGSRVSLARMKKE